MIPTTRRPRLARLTLRRCGGRNGRKHGFVEPNVEAEPTSTKVEIAAPDGIVYMLDARGRIVANLTNAARWLASGAVGLISRDSFTGVVTWRGVPVVRDTDYLRIACEVQAAVIGFETPFARMQVNTITDAVQLVAERNTFNSCADWLGTLPPWDGVERLPSFFVDVVGCDASDYVHGVGRYFWHSLVARMLEPGCKADAAVVLVGSQGIGKSALGRIVGGERYGEASLVHIGERDWCAALRGKVLVEISELAGQSRAELESVKAVLSRQFDEYRTAYGRITSIVPRSCMFYGTTNEHQFLIDPSGNRRWLPIDCRGAIALKTVVALREQYFAEAYAGVRSGAARAAAPDWWAVPDAAAVQAEHVATDPWIDVLDEQLRLLDGELPERITNVRLYELLKIPAERQTGGGTGRRLTRVMRSLGYEGKRFPVAGVSVRGFVRETIGGVVHGSDG